jgi:tyrosinase
MIDLTLSRRRFLGATASALSLASMPKLLFAATTPYVRLEWQQFKLTPQYASFLNAVRTMRAVTDATNANSWQYWANIHYNNCPHGIPYFLAWHRGYIYLFERQLRRVSGDSALNLPYWNYYADPTIPAEFTDSATDNPLYVPRMNTDVYNALDLSPFAASVVNFQRGTPGSFEVAIETAPHDPVHDIIGDVMSTMYSPLDPIFYLHHANIDRLWHAWALPYAGTMPAPTASYWAGSLTYAPGLGMSTQMTYWPQRLGYDYSNDSRPTALPPEAGTSGIVRVQAQIQPIRLRPPIVSLLATTARTITVGLRSIGGVTGLPLAEESLSTRVVTDANSATAVQDLLSRIRPAYQSAAIDPQGLADALARIPEGQYRSIRLVLDDIVMTDAGLKGGYFYNVYLNLPEGADVDSARSRNFLGVLGPFEVAGAAHHGRVMLHFPATESLLKMDVSDAREYVVSLVRVNGPNTPKGQVMHVGEMRVELSTDAPFALPQ